MANSESFKPFEVGTLFNDAQLSSTPQLIEDRSVAIDYPARLEAMALDPSKIAENESLTYTAGQIDFTVGLYKHVQVTATESEGATEISDRTGRKALVMHAAELMRAALRFTDTIQVDIETDVSLRHCGLGSSSGTIAAVASAINELYGRPMDGLSLSRYVAQNHGEEIDGDDSRLIPVQCIGGSAVCGNTEGGLVILSGEATPIFTAEIPEQQRVVIGVPADFDHPDSKELMKREQDNMEGFVETGKANAERIAYRLVHEVMPSLVHGDLSACKSLIFDYRWNMGSIRNCSFVLPRINDIAEALRPLETDEDITILSLSSVGPGFFALTDKPEKVSKIFKEQGMNVLETSIHNSTYTVRGNK